jgi:parvulin-like peptidyl-prolyl isomerase
LERNFSLGALIGISMLVFTATATATAGSEVLDRIVAVVNEDIILLSELRERMAPFAQRIRKQGFDLDQERQMLFKVRGDMLDRLVDEKLTDQEIKRNGIQVEETEIDNTIERIKAANSFTDEDLRRIPGAGADDHRAVSESNQRTNSAHTSGQLRGQIQNCHHRSGNPGLLRQSPRALRWRNSATI